MTGASATAGAGLEPLATEPQEYPAGHYVLENRWHRREPGRGAVYYEPGQVVELSELEARRLRLISRPATAEEVKRGRAAEPEPEAAVEAAATTEKAAPASGGVEQ